MPHRRDGRAVPCRSLAGLGVGGLVAFCASATLAAPVGAPDASASRGAPIAQTFLEDHGDNVSLVATPNGVSCVASRPLPIREARYRDTDGTDVPFAEIVRSPASSIQAIARTGAPVAFRIQLKYTPDAKQPLRLRVGQQAFDLAEMVEPSRDSVLVTGAVAEALATTFAAGDAAALDGVSADTGRLIGDRIDPPSLAGLDACLETLGTLADADAAASADAADGVAGAASVAGAAASDAVGAGSAAASELRLVQAEARAPVLPVPVAGVRLDLVARPDPELRLTEEQLQACRMRDIPETLYLGRLTAVTGFFSQTRDVYVAFDEEGRLERAYVPGIFDSDFAGGANIARLSLAADSNVPDAPHAVRGCLGDARLQAPLCALPSDADGAYVLAECGVLGVSDDREEPFAQLLAWGAPVTPAAAGIGAGTFMAPTPRGASVPGGGGGGGGGFPPGGGSPVPPGVTPFPPGNPDIPPGGPPNGPPPETPDIPPVPLPAAFWLMLGSLASLPGLRVLCRRAREA